MSEKTKLSKKQKVLIIIGAIVLVIVGVILYLNINASKTSENMHSQIQKEEVKAKTSYISESLDYDINFYSKDNVTADYIAINMLAKQDILNDTELTLALEASKLINGLSLEAKDTNDGKLIKALIQRDKINEEMIDLAMKIELVDESQKGLLEVIASGNIEEIKSTLQAAGYKID